MPLGDGMSPRGQAPSWLYSFVDLAFLLLITVSQLDIAVSKPVDLGEIRVPRVDGEATSDLPPQAADRWQVRVHPPNEAETPPFELVRAGAEAADEPHPRLDRDALRGELEALHQAKARKPLLAPHEHSHSKDLLAAVSIVEELWPSGRWATITPEPPIRTR